MTRDRVLIAVLATLASVPGVLAYRGVYRRWAPADRHKLEGLRFDTHTWPLVLAWLAGGTAVVMWVSAVHTYTKAFDVVLFVGLGAQLVSMLLLVHVPWVLHPRWYRTEAGVATRRRNDRGELDIRGRVRWGLAALVLALLLGVALQFVEG